LESPLALAKLKKVVQEYWDTEGGMSVQLLLPFLEIPSVETFWAKMVADDSLWSSSSTRSFPNIKELSLLFASIPVRLLTPFLRSFPHLERLYYNHGAFEYADFDPSRLMAALSHVKPHLQDLTIINNNKVSCALSTYFPIGSLSSFENLRRLDLDCDTLIGRDRSEKMMARFQSRQDIVTTIPASLVELRIRDHNQQNDRLYQQVSQLLQQRQSFPALRQLDLEWKRINYPDKPSPREPFIYPGFTEEQCLEVLSLCEETGVEMMMKAMPPKMKYISYPKLNANGSLYKNEFGIGYQVGHAIPYPYEDYERICKENGCELDTGRPKGAWY